MRKIAYRNPFKSFIHNDKPQHMYAIWFTEYRLSPSPDIKDTVAQFRFQFFGPKMLSPCKSMYVLGMILILSFIGSIHISCLTLQYDHQRSFFGLHSLDYRNHIFLGSYPVTQSVIQILTLYFS